MLKIVTLSLLISFNLLRAEVETWTSVDGRTLEGKFVVHLPHREEVVIERAVDRRQFHIPMAQLIQSDQLRVYWKASGFEEPYWYTDLDAAIEANSENIWILVRNGSDQAGFEWFIHHLLLRKAFHDMCRRMGLVICVLDEMNNEILTNSGILKVAELRDQVQSQRRESRFRTFEDLREPYILKLSPRMANVINATVFTWITSLYKPYQSSNPDPFAVSNTPREFISINDLDQRIRGIRPVGR